MGSERDGGREAIQNCYPVAMKPPAGRNAADLSASHLRSDRLVVGSHERLAGLEASSVHWTLRQCRESFNCVFAMQNQTQKPPCATRPILQGWHHAATDCGSHVVGAGAGAEGEGGGWRE